MTSDKKATKKGIIAIFDSVMGKIRRFFVETTAEMGRCSWPSRSELLESTILVVVAIVMLGVFVAIVDILARYFVSFITTGTF